jgi:Uma2 family endonuclease
MPLELTYWQFSIADRYLMSDYEVYPVDGRYDVVDFYQLLGIGVFNEDDHVELIDGEMIALERRSPPHAYCVMLLTRPLILQTDDSVLASVHNPLRLDQFNEMLPDIALIHRNWNVDDHPRPWDTELVVEACDTSWAYDHDIKLPLYASFRIPEVWLIDVNACRVQRYREPNGAKFTLVDHYDPGDQIVFDRIPGYPVTIDLDGILR